MRLVFRYSQHDTDNSGSSFATSMASEAINGVIDHKRTSRCSRMFNSLRKYFKCRQHAWAPEGLEKHPSYSTPTQVRKGWAARLAGSCQGTTIVLILARLNRLQFTFHAALLRESLGELSYAADVDIFKNVIQSSSSTSSSLTRAPAGLCIGCDTLP